MAACAELIEPVTVYTVQSDFVTRYSGVTKSFLELHMPHPYRRIVGAEFEGEELWVPQVIPCDRDSAFDKAQAEPETLPFDGVLGERFFSFFRDYMSEEGRAEHGPYNCHLMGDHMLGIEDDTWKDRPILQRSIIEHGRRVRRNLRAGQIGVIGCLMGGEDPQPHHSLIGLGEDRDECLQAMWINGHIGIARYDDLEAFYKKLTGGMFRTLRGVTQLGLYTVEQVNNLATNTANRTSALVASATA